MRTRTHLLSRLHYLLALLVFLLPGAAALAAPPRPAPYLVGPAPGGNYVFLDANQNNIFDAAESGINNVTVCLYTRDGVLRQSVKTNTSGLYSFTGIQASTDYDIRIKAADAPVGLKLVLANQGSDPNANSDAMLYGSTAAIQVTSSAGGTITNQSFGYAAGDPDIALTKSADSFSVAKGGTATFTVSLTNVGGSTAFGVVIKDTLDTGMGYVTSSPLATTALLASGRVELTWSVGSLTAAASSSYGVTVRANADGVLSNVAAATSSTPDATPRNNIARACFTVPVRLCAGESFATTLDASLTNVQWYRNGATIGTGNSLTILTSGTYTYTALAGSADCQTSSCCPIVIYDGSVTPPILTASSLTVCFGSTVSLSATNCTNGTLTWSTGPASNGLSTITVTPLVIGSNPYSVTCTPTADNACPAFATVNITVNPSVTATVASQTMCFGTSATLSAVATGGSSFTYAWSPSASISGTGASVTATPAATTTYTVVVTNNFGCVSSTTATVTVNPAVTATVGSQTICLNTSATLSAIATGGSSFTYAWSPSASITGTGASVTATPTATTTYTVVVTNNFGCVSSATATVTVNPVLAVNISAAPSFTICNGLPTVLTAAATPGTSFNYRWSATATNAASITVSPSTTTPYSVTVTDQITSCSGVASTTVTVNPTPSLQLNSPIVCQGTEAVLSVTGCTGGTVRWSNNETGSILPVTPLQTTDYTATCTLPTGCTSAITATVTVTPAPSGTALAKRATCTGGTANPNAEIVISGLQNTARASISTANANNAAAFGAATTVTGTSITFINLPDPSTQATYLVKLYNADGSCIATLTVLLEPANCVCPAPKCVPISIRKLN